MKKKVAILALSLFLPSMAFAATDTYRTGSMIFHFAAGTSMPGFIHFFGDAGGLDSDHWLWGEDDHATKLNWGGNFSLGFERFTSSTLSLGGELGYDFNYCVNDDLFTAVPLQFKLTWYPVQGTVDLQVSLGIGTVYERFGEDKSMLNLSLSLDVGMNFYIWEHWGVGIHSGLWLIPEFNYNSGDQENDGVLGLVPITLLVSYRNL